MAIAQKLRRYRFRLRRGIDDLGVAGVARAVGGRVLSVEVEHVWYAFDLARVKPFRFRGAYELHLATQSDAELLLRELPAIPAAEARGRIADGVQLWFVLCEGEPAFFCSCYLDRYPIVTRDGWYALPEGVACLENGFTSRKHRGRLIAPAAWTAIGERLRDDGYEVLIAKVEANNIASRRTMEKTGFRAATTMRRTRRGVRTRVAFRETGVELTPAEHRAAEDLARNASR